LEGAGWQLIGALNENFGTIGFIIIGVFVASWTISYIIYRVKRYDEIEVTCSPSLR
jgi:high-affinity nickel-transport protein